MRKKDELTNQHSCLNKSQDDEMVFVLRAHDKCAPRTIILWIEERILSGLNQYDDPQIQEAFKTASIMIEQRKDGY